MSEFDKSNVRIYLVPNLMWIFEENIFNESGVAGVV